MGQARFFRPFPTHPGVEDAAATPLLSFEHFVVWLCFVESHTPYQSAVGE